MRIGKRLPQQPFHRLDLESRLLQAFAERAVARRLPSFTLSTGELGQTSQGRPLCPCADENVTIMLDDGDPDRGLA